MTWLKGGGGRGKECHCQNLAPSHPTLPWVSNRGGRGNDAAELHAFFGGDISISGWSEERTPLCGSQDMIEMQMVKRGIPNGLPTRLVYRTIYVVIITFVAVSIPFFGSLMVTPPLPPTPPPSAVPETRISLG